ncbi:MAG: TRAP transporter large permease subunit, partial [Deltaproteobacteria bacterium]|nr:TRAP transporter large permease subunit [Deltaproteobacteria bacterium]
MIHLSPELLTVLMFAGLLIGIFMGHHLAFVLGGLAIIFGWISWGPSIFALFINRIWGLMDNYVLLAIPLFIFMAQLLNQSGVADDLFDALRYLLGTLKGGVALTVIVVSTIFAACTGIIGASVVTMGFLALPIMMRYE